MLKEETRLGNIVSIGGRITTIKGFYGTNKVYIPLDIGLEEFTVRFSEIDPVPLVNSFKGIKYVHQLQNYYSDIITNKK